MRQIHERIADHQRTLTAGMIVVLFVKRKNSYH
jgi:hypothetical protein